MGEKPAVGLTQSLEKHGLKVGRLKTGTPPRILSDSVNWSLTTIANGDNNPTPFSFFDLKFLSRQRSRTFDARSPAATFLGSPFVMPPNKRAFGRGSVPGRGVA